MLQPLCRRIIQALQRQARQHFPRRLRKGRKRRRKLPLPLLRLRLMKLNPMKRWRDDFSSRSSVDLVFFLRLILMMMDFSKLVVQKVMRQKMVPPSRGPQRQLCRCQRVNKDHLRSKDKRTRNASRRLRRLGLLLLVRQRVQDLRLQCPRYRLDLLQEDHLI